MTKKANKKQVDIMNKVISIIEWWRSSDDLYDNDLHELIDESILQIDGLSREEQQRMRDAVGRLFTWIKMFR